MTHQGCLCYQIFNKGIKAPDFLGFMCNLTQTLRSKEGRQGSVIKEKQPVQGMGMELDAKWENEAYVHRGKKSYVYVMDNAKQHRAKAVK